MKNTVVASPLSRNKIRQQALRLRQIFGFDNSMWFPIVEFLEIVLPQVSEDFTFLVLETKEMEEGYGLTIPGDNLISVREDVYERALAGVGRDRFTLAHELGHFLLHTSENVGLTRLPKESSTKAYLNPEWQANTFAGELLIPSNLIESKSVSEISTECGVSLQAAQIQIDVLKNAEAVSKMCKKKPPGG